MDFGYKKVEIAEAFGIKEDEVGKMLEEIDPEGKVRVGISQQLIKCKDIRRSAESMITPQRMDGLSAKELMQIAIVANDQENKLESRMQRSTRLMLPEDLKQNVLGLLGEGKDV